MQKPIVVEKFADNGQHSHWELIDSDTGETLWQEPEQEQALQVANVTGSSSDDAVDEAWTWLVQKGTVYGGQEHGDCFKAVHVLRALQKVNRANCR